MNVRSYTLKQVDSYFASKQDTIHQLPIPKIDLTEVEDIIPRMTQVKLPEWGQLCGVDGHFLVPEYLAGDGSWEKVDWIHTCFWFMNGLAEREFEQQNGPIHSFSYKLKGWDSRIWDHAWGNRIALFLREWAAHEKNLPADELFGELPEPNIILTHDVDAVSKTLAIRFKQTAFHIFNCLRNLKELRLKKSGKSLVKAIRFLIAFDDYWQFEKIIRFEEKHGIKSHFNFFAGDVSFLRSLKKKLFDPGYNITRPKLKSVIRKLHSKGCTIGLHQAFDSWQCENSIKVEKEKLESVLGGKVTSCRQHWLRFSWLKTWEAQAKAGFEWDTTLGFNDRPGFRNGFALKFKPWDYDLNCEMKLDASTNVLMDSQFYDYYDYTGEERKSEIKRWIDEVKFVHGSVTLIWHQRSLSKDYKWHQINSVLSDIRNLV